MTCGAQVIQGRYNRTEKLTQTGGHNRSSVEANLLVPHLLVRNPGTVWRGQGRNSSGLPRDHLHESLLCPLQ